MPQCTCNIDLGYELIVHPDSVLGAAPDYADAVFVDIDIPAGKDVVGSGAIFTQINGADATPDHPYWNNAVREAKTLSGPHPDDPSKWRVFVSIDGGGSVSGTSVTLRAWIAVISA